MQSSLCALYLLDHPYYVQHLYLVLMHEESHFAPIFKTPFFIQDSLIFLTFSAP